MTYTLGINVSHDASICLLKDAEIVLYLEEERTSRIKRDDFPATAFNSLKQHLDLPLDNVVLISAKYVIPEAIEYILYSLRKHHLMSEHTQIYNYEGRHHECHAANAFYSSGFEDAGCLIMDGSGSKTPTGVEIESHYHASGNEIFPVKKITYDEDNPGSISIGRAFDLVAQYCGFSVHGDAGKVMGLAPYGNAKNVPQLFTEGGESDPELITWYSINLDVKPADLAARIQRDSLVVSINSIRDLITYTGCKNVCLSGGYFLNCVNNYEYLAVFPEINFYVDPIAHDGGTSIGAARLLYSRDHEITPRKLETLYLG
jgi:carbamoyltransferase